MDDVELAYFFVLLTILGSAVIAVVLLKLAWSIKKRRSTE